METDRLDPPCPVPWVSHVEWGATNTERTRDFLAALFGWSFRRIGRRYWLHEPANPCAPRVGIMPVDSVVPATATLVHVTVPSIDAAIQRARALGAGVAVAKTLVPDYGWYAQVTDPDGNLVGLFEGLDSAPGKQ